MKMAAIIKKALLAAALPLAAAQVNVTAAAPVVAPAAPAAPQGALQKVVGLLKAMKDKGLAELQKEQVQFAAYQQWCTGALAAKAKATDSATQAASLLQADANLAGAMSATDGQDASKLDTAIAGITDSKAQAQTARASELAEFQKAHEAYTTAILAIDSAVSVLTSGGPIPAKAVALIQQFESAESAKARKAVADFLADYKEVSLVQDAPSARSGAIVDMLQRLRIKFVDERNALEQQELSRKSAFALQVKSLDNSLDAAKKQKSTQIQAKAEQDSTKATKQGQLVNLQRTIDDNNKIVSEINATCAQAAADYATRQGLRQKELDALDKALQLLSGVKPKAFLQVATALLNIKKADVRPAQQQVAAYLHSQAERLESSVLSTLAVEATKDPFVKVRGMIQDLITRLESEAGQEAQHKQWCTTEMASNKQTRDDKTQSVKWLKNEVDLLNSEVSKLDSDIAAFSAQIAQTNQTVAQQQSLTGGQQSLNNQTLQDAQQAQAAIAQAIALLNQFYGLVQVGQQQPTLAKGSYGYLKSDGKAVLALLNYIKEDYDKLVAATLAQGATSQEAVTKVADDATVLLRQLTADVQQKTTEKALKQQLVLDKSRDLATGQKELDAAITYSNKLQSSCLGDPKQTAEARKERREAEVQSLQEALRMLNTA